jgi:outer membrane receptor protein involved in Fe transport
MATFSISASTPFRSRVWRGYIAGILLGAPLGAQMAAPPAAVTELNSVIVTGTREQALLRETPVAVGAISSAAIQLAAPLHPGQLLGQIPGVAVAVTNGEGHTTSIRQPFTTGPVYLFLEDGVPIRATGFFNHNALYEVNLAQAGGIEVVRGPGTALYGSDAIGGIINVLSRAPAQRAEGTLSAEAGAFGTRRALASASGGTSAVGAARLDFTQLHTDGWRENTAYDRTSANLRWDFAPSARTDLKFIAAYARINQQTGANSALVWADYLQNPRRNLMPIAFRDVRALRASLELQHRLGNGTATLLPYWRNNAMDLNGTYNLSSDPRLERTHNVSYGLLAKWRQNFAPGRSRLIVGFDWDRSPGARLEDNLLVTRSGTGANTVYSGYSFGTRIYDYHVTFRSLSPYVHGETSLTRALRLTVGVRHDRLGYAMVNQLPAGTIAASVLGANRSYGQLARDDRDFTRTSPKIGATYAVTPHVSLYLSRNFGFRVPAESQLYRAGNDASASAALAKSRLVLGLKPIKAAQSEVGLRGELRQLEWSVAAYELVKRDDLLSQRDLVTNVSTNVNAGRTSHRGVEIGAGYQPDPRVRLDVTFSYAEHRYVDWVTGTANYSGRSMESAPRVMANSRVAWTPRRGTTLQAEWVRLGSYWLEASNAPAFGRYPGHDLVNLRASHTFAGCWKIFGRIMNVANRRFADSASVSANTPVFSPGLPRAFYAGMEVAW